MFGSAFIMSEARAEIGIVEPRDSELLATVVEGNLDVQVENIKLTTAFRRMNLQKLLPRLMLTCLYSSE